MVQCLGRRLGKPVKEECTKKKKTSTRTVTFSLGKKGKEEKGHFLGEMFVPSEEGKEMRKKRLGLKRISLEEMGKPSCP